MNKIICKSCRTENLFEAYKCSNCSNVMRAKVSNIDFWAILYQLLFDTTLGFKQIVYAENKNFVAALFILLNLKLSTLLLAVCSVYDLGFSFSEFWIILFVLTIASSIFVFLYLETLRIIFVKIYQVDILRKNYFSIVGYASSFFSMSIFILLPIELLLFGQYLFSSNPSPFAIKEIPAYLTAGLEVFAALSFFALLYYGLKTYLCSNKVSILLTGAVGAIFPILYCSFKFFITIIKAV
ncbi:MAG: hypothetical protein KJ666_06835 [Bacteroidetes bacterium]|nr:hypothetical protein [Bacteroidota bacterium]MBU2585946.1 hypothetical protein [Bacteroidota bacterium]